MIQLRLLTNFSFLAVMFFSMTSSAVSNCNLDTPDLVRFRMRMLEIISAGRAEEAGPFQKVLAQANDPKVSTETLRFLVEKISTPRLASDTESNAKLAEHAALTAEFERCLADSKGISSMLPKATCVETRTKILLAKVKLSTLATSTFEREETYFQVLYTQPKAGEFAAALAALSQSRHKTWTAYNAVKTEVSAAYAAKNPNCSKR